ncbi:FAD-binding domain-containing protein [Peniophora sp. CONT]|nr:FAD-binding domain-containing protein [Peniophora sp. CONT]
MLSLGLPLLLPVVAVYASPTARSVEDVCSQIASTVSSASNVYQPLSIQYEADVKHWAASSAERATCSVEPGTAEDVGKILQIVGSTNTSFAVKGGGHASNPGFSSTQGVMIAMSRFSNVTLSADKSTVEVGAGLIWDDVYSALEDSGVNVVGGRVPGVGVAGFTLGGGYSWKTNQYGLTIDNIAAYELVLPNGTVTTVTEEDEDLWFALRGGGNNFGVVTKFTLVTHPQSDMVWGGLITLTDNAVDAISAATANFSATNTDPKAAILPAYNSLLGAPGMALILFYDGPTPPAGMFDAFLAPPHFTSDVSTRKFADLIQAVPATNPLEGPRAAFMTASVLQYTPAMLSLVHNMTREYGTRLAALDTAPFISFDIEPFLSDIFTHGSASAYPPDRSRGLLPTNLYFSWELPSLDDEIRGIMKDLASQITAQAVAEGQDVADAFIYGNYALADTPLEAIYGGNVARLRAIHNAVDPNNVMALAGGFKF